MRLKEIKPNMAIHCQNEEEFEELCKHCKIPVFRSILNNNIAEYVFFIRDDKYKGMTWNAYEGFKSMTDILVEFSDLVIEDSENNGDRIELSSETEDEELTAKEAIKLRAEICTKYDCEKCYLRNESYLTCDEWTLEHPEEVIEVLKQYKKDHDPTTPKEPDVEWVYECYNLDEGEHHDSLTYSKEEDAIKFCELWTVGKDSKLGYTYRKVCRVKEN